TEAVMWGSSFFSSNCTTPLYAVYLVWLACRQEFRPRDCVPVVLVNCFFLVTYPEFLIVLKGFEGLALLLAFWQGRRRHWLPLAVSNLAVAALHPLAVLDKVPLLPAQVGGNNGWNVLGDPVAAPRDFLANVFGLGHGNVGHDYFRQMPAVGTAVLALILAQVAAGLWLLCRRYRVGWAVLPWLGLLAAMHA